MGFIPQYDQPQFLQPLSDVLQNKDFSKIHLKGLCGSAESFVVARIIEKEKHPVLIILPDFEQSAYYFSDLKAILTGREILFFPSSYRRSMHYEKIDQENIVLRAEVLNKLIGGKSKTVVVTYSDAILEQVVVKETLQENTLKIHKSEKISIDFITEVLNEYGFERNDFVFEPGQFSIRGSIVDIYSFSNEYPYRLDFFGDEVDTIRTFDIETQLSKDLLEQITVIPDIKQKLSGEAHDILLRYFNENSVVIAKDLSDTTQFINNFLEKTGNLDFENLKLIRAEDFINSLEPMKVFETGSRYHFKADKEILFNTNHQPAFQKNFDFLVLNLIDNIEKGYVNYIVSDNEKQFERLNAIFGELHEELLYEPVGISLHEGFIDHNEKICVYTDHQIFERYHKYSINKNFSKREAISLQELTDLQPGDFVVHVDHGIGVFGGLTKIEVNGKIQESVKLVYKDNDVLFVNIHSLHKISKYRGKDSEEPKVYKLGSGAWQKLKQATKKKIKDIAKDLIRLYAKRKKADGFAFSPDSYLQKELEASFIYEDTPDQYKATQNVKQDMESGIPMDRLVCGDVGFGKTEVAIRAAFKAVADSKQVAVLVPTTILALQHFQTFSARLKGYPCNIDYINRFKSSTQQRETIKALKEGKIDIIIGTHRLVGKDLVFKDLGLLIIDEEQKFGVAVKEKLREIKMNVDTLTLTATPIPRTMQFSMMGARDLSIINTPPPNRHPIVTELHVFNETIIREAIEYEVNRGGQVFFIHNRVQNIEEIAFLLRKLCPKLSVVTAHGQMEGNKLEKIMLDFVSGDYDVLIATTIIESGLDIPNVNTIIINNAHNFGLSDLHQLRGRVGRSNKKAFCYLLAPPVTMQTPEARRRLKAIEEYSDLGSGFYIALQDLDIRGAGNLLGAEQSGFIADIGYETYHKILDEAIRELKETEFKDVYQDEQEDDTEKTYVTDCSIETDFEIMLPETYIENVTERLKLYKRLDSIATEEELVSFEKELADRFGKLPDEVADLLEVVRMRWKAISLGFEKVIIRNGKLLAYFVNNPDSDYFKSPVFKGILQYLQEHPKGCQMKEINQKLVLIIEPVNHFDKAVKLLTNMYENSVLNPA